MLKRRGADQKVPSSAAPRAGKTNVCFGPIPLKKSELAERINRGVALAAALSQPD